MSGPIRKVLGPQRARIKALIAKELEKLPDDAGLLPEQKQQNINMARIRLGNDRKIVWGMIEKLQNGINFLLSKDKDWCVLIQKVPANQSAAEEKIYSEAVSSPDGHMAVINAGQDKLAELKSMVPELDFIYQSIQERFQSEVEKQRVKLEAQQLEIEERRLQEERDERQRRKDADQALLSLEQKLFLASAKKRTKSRDGKSKNRSPDLI